jgi:hypothetical protein
MVYTQPLFKKSENMFCSKIFMFLYITKLKYTREGRIRNEFGLKTGDCSEVGSCAEEHISNTNILCGMWSVLSKTYTQIEL